MTNKVFFNPEEFYESYPAKAMLRPGYPARAQFKSTLMWNLFGEYVLRQIGRIQSYADIGGCFGFGANSMAFHISKSQGDYPVTKVFEIAPDFIKLGKQLFPYIDFVQGDFKEWNHEPKVFDLITLFDTIEHIVDPHTFLRAVASHSKFALLLTPMETSGEWRGGGDSASKARV